MNRRNFLQTAAATPLVFGLDDLLAQDAGDERKPAWLKTALQQMKDLQRDAIVLIAPADERGRRALGEALHALTESKDPDVRELFVEAVFVCMTPELAKKHLPAGDGNRVLLSPDGKRASGDTVDAEAIEKEFVASMRTLLHGAKNERFPELVARGRAVVDVGKALDEIDTDGPEPAEAIRTVRAHAAKIAPWLVFARMDAVHEKGRARLRAVLAGLPGGQVPYGASLPRFTDICGHWREIEKPEDDIGGAVECGMAKAGRNSRKFLKFLTE